MGIGSIFIEAVLPFPAVAGCETVHHSSLGKIVALVAGGPANHPAMRLQARTVLLYTCCDPDDQKAATRDISRMHFQD